MREIKYKFWDTTIGLMYYEYSIITNHEDLTDEELGFMLRNKQYIGI